MVRSSVRFSVGHSSNPSNPFSTSKTIEQGFDNDMDGVPSMPAPNPERGGMRSSLTKGVSTRPTLHRKNSGGIGGSGRLNTSSSNLNGNPNPSAAGSGGVVNTRAALAANDGPSLAAALAQSIRHHARMIDGNSKTLRTFPSKGRVGSVGGVGNVLGYDNRYEQTHDDDHVTLAPNVERGFEKDAYLSIQQEGNVLPVLRDYVANAGVGADGNGTAKKRGSEASVGTGMAGGGMGGADVDDSFRNRFSITNWFRRWGGNDDNDANNYSKNKSKQVEITGLSADKSRSVRFAQDDAAAIAAAIANGEVPLEDVNNLNGVGGEDGKVAFNVGNMLNAGAGVISRTPTFVAPPPTSFRTATSHPSPIGEGGINESYRRRGVSGIGGPNANILMRKRQRRHDLFLRIMVAIVCFGASLTFAIMFGEGKFGLLMSTATVDHKTQKQLSPVIDPMGGVGTAYAVDDPKNEPMFYPEWWDRLKGVPDPSEKLAELPHTLMYNAADLEKPRAPGRIETPFFWVVPKSGANVVRTIMSKCLRLAEASESGAGSDQNPNQILVIKGENDRRFVNVDMSTSEGIERAKSLNLASSGVPDVIISSILHDVLDIFNNRNRARVFTILRPPLERAISKYYSDLATDPEVAGMTLTQYVRSGGTRVENNYLTRFLSGKYGGPLEIEDLNVAREFLRTKVVVGLANDLHGTIYTYNQVFRWNETAMTFGLEGVSDCYNNIFNALSDKPPPAVEEGSEGWRLLVAQNWFDLKVYEYAEQLFLSQLKRLDVATTE